MEYIANRLQTTFIPGEDPDGSERRVVADQPVVIYRPKRQRVAGLTFVVTAANIPLSKYTSIINALNAVDHVVVGFFVNVLKPPLRNNRVKAERITKIFQVLKEEFKVKQYDLVGHSIGGKIALLTAALYDDEHWIRNIVALDPVDQSPVEFTNDILSRTISAKRDAPPQSPFSGTDDDSAAISTSKRGGRTNLSLESSLADITLTFTDTGYWIGKKHNAREIQKNNPFVKLVMHRNSCHMVYCDNDGLLSWKALMGQGTSAHHNQVVREKSLTLIKEKAMRSKVTTGHASGKVQSRIGKAKKAMTNGISDLKELGEEAQNKGRQVTALSKFLG